MDCSDAIQDLHETLASLYEDNFNNIAQDFDNQLSMLEHMTNTYDNDISKLEAQNYLGSTQYYTALKDVEQQNISVLNQELAALKESLSSALASGEIDEFSESWYGMKQEINEVQEAIQQANTSLIEYNNSIRELEWGYFDFVQERIKNITDESEFLISLMSNSELYTDKGQLTDTGMATMGLHGVEYNTYMSQADQYAEELMKINKELAEDPYNTALIERREELLGLQQDSILAAEDEKQAIVDMVKEGIELELSALKDLIDAYTDSLDSAKDLYDYQKKIADQTSEIASLQKQLSAYENDTSEETKAKVQQLKVDLEEAQTELKETEYEQYIKDQKQLLDELYDEYEEILNQRLDNIDALIMDMIDTINGNASSINDTLQTESANVGYTMTENMQTIWDGATNAINGVISTYGDGFTEKLTSINEVLNSILADVASMVQESDAAADSSISSSSSSQKPESDSSSTKPSPSPSPSTPSTQQITIGGKINAKGAKIYDYAGDTSGENQYFGSDPIYTVLDESKGYLKVRWHKLSSGVTGWFKKSDVKAYKTGGLVDYTGLAQLDGTPGKPEIVLNAQDTDNFLQLRDVLREMSQQELTMAGQPLNASTYSVDILPQLRSVTDVSRILSELKNNPVSQNVEYTFGDTNINIDHVQDYNDFVKQLQHDSQFEKMIQAITFDKVTSKSSLAKYKYQW